MRDFRRLTVWQKAHSLALETYKVTRNFPKEELYGLTSQLRRAVISIPSNIAEGCGRRSDAELARFLDIASGSACETEYQLLLARNLNYLSPTIHAELEQLVCEVKRMLTAFQQRLK